MSIGINVVFVPSGKLEELSKFLNEKTHDKDTLSLVLHSFASRFSPNNDQLEWVKVLRALKQEEPGQFPALLTSLMKGFLSKGYTPEAANFLKLVQTYFPERLLAILLTLSFVNKDTKFPTKLTPGLKEEKHATKASGMFSVPKRFIDKEIVIQALAMTDKSTVRTLLLSNLKGLLKEEETVLVSKASRFTQLMKKESINYHQALAFIRPDVLIWVLQFNSFLSAKGRVEVPNDLVLLIASYLLPPSEGKAMSHRGVSMRDLYDFSRRVLRPLPPQGPFFRTVVPSQGLLLEEPALSSTKEEPTRCEMNHPN